MLCTSQIAHWLNHLFQHLRFELLYLWDHAVLEFVSLMVTMKIKMLSWVAVHAVIWWWWWWWRWWWWWWWRRQWWRWCWVGLQCPQWFFCNTAFYSPLLYALHNSATTVHCILMHCLLVLDFVGIFVFVHFTLSLLYALRNCATEYP